MNEIKPEETEITGQWQLDNKRLVADATTKRIEALIGHDLEKIGHDSSGWLTLYRDPNDG